MLPDNEMRAQKETPYVSGLEYQNYSGKRGGLNFCATSRGELMPTSHNWPTYLCYVVMDGSMMLSLGDFGLPEIEIWLYVHLINASVDMPQIKMDITPGMDYVRFDNLIEPHKESGLTIEMEESLPSLELQNLSYNEFQRLPWPDFEAGICKWREIMDVEPHIFLIIATGSWLPKHLFKILNLISEFLLNFLDTSAVMLYGTCLYGIFDCRQQKEEEVHVMHVIGICWGASNNTVTMPTSPRFCILSFMLQPLNYLVVLETGKKIACLVV